MKVLEGQAVHLHLGIRQPFKFVLEKIYLVLMHMVAGDHTM